MIKFKKIAIIGVGLIGGSISLGLKSRLGKEIEIIEISKETDISTIPETDMIIISTPISQIPEVISKTMSLAKAETVMDVGSIKGDIIDFVEQKKYSGFVGTHPMAGREMGGYTNADPNLFINKPWIVCRTSKSTPRNVESVSELIELLGGKIIHMPARQHDEVVTWASHLSLVFSSLLVSATAKQKNWDMIRKTASTGFRDTTRLASQNPSMKSDIITSNRGNVINALQTFQKEIEEFLSLIQKGEENAVLSYFAKSKRDRDKWLTKYFMA